MLRLDVHVHPGARVAAVGGDYDGKLTVRVRARAVDGAATDEVRRALAEAFAVREGTVRLIRGAHSRNKTFEIGGDDAALERRRDELRGM